MDGTQKTNYEMIFYIITVGMIFLSFAIIVFVIVYQRKMQRKRFEFQQLKLDNQQQLTTSIIEAKEAEQRRIALELHDDVGSTLTAIKFMVAVLPEDLAAKEKLNETLVNVIKKVRRISNELLPTVLEEFGLIAALNSLSNQLNDQISGINIQITATNHGVSEAQTKDVELSCYRIIQELLNNIIKYANATIVTIQVNQSSSGLNINVIDNGDGFNPKTHTPKSLPTLGLKNMESRVQHIGAKMNFKKSENGTKVSLRWKPQQEI
jgi:signal transduction histidine kinase